MSPAAGSLIAQHIIDVAGGLFYREGINAVGIDRIIEESGVAKATMYRHFSGKAELVAACLRQRHAEVITSLRHELERSPVAGPERVLTVFDFLHLKARSETFRGCAFMIAVAENEGNQAVREIACEHKSAVRAIFLELLPTILPERETLASSLNLLYDGALAQVLLFRDNSAPLLARDCAVTLLKVAAGKA